MARRSNEPVQKRPVLQLSSRLGHGLRMACRGRFLAGAVKGSRGVGDVCSHAWCRTNQVHLAHSIHQIRDHLARVLIGHHEPSAPMLQAMSMTAYCGRLWKGCGFMHQHSQPSPLVPAWRVESANCLPCPLRILEFWQGARHMNSVQQEWMKLCERVIHEQDPERFLQLIVDVNNMLWVKQNRLNTQRAKKMKVN